MAALAGGGGSDEMEPPTVSNNNGTEYGQAPEYWLNTPYLIHIVECFYLAYILIVKYTTLILVWC